MPDLLFKVCRSVTDLQVMCKVRNSRSCASVRNTSWTRKKTHGHTSLSSDHQGPFQQKQGKSLGFLTLWVLHTQVIYNCILQLTAPHQYPSFSTSPLISAEAPCCPKLWVYWFYGWHLWEPVVQSQATSLCSRSSEWLHPWSRAFYHVCASNKCHDSSNSQKRGPTGRKNSQTY